MSYQFTVFRRGEFDAYQRLVARLRPAAPDPGAAAADLRHRWRTFENPWGGYFLLAHTDDDLAATLTLSARRLRTPGGEVLPCYELGDGWTSDRHRRKGLFFALGERARDLVFSGGEARIIIGAPNPSAEPNWRKHRYLFTDDDGSRLVLAPNPPEVLRWRALRRARPVAARRPLLPQLPPLAGGWRVEELPFDEYARRAGALPRMNDGAAPAAPGAAEEAGGYLRWRLRDSPDGYRYFRATAEGVRRAVIGAMSGAGASGSGASELLCALRVTHLGDLPVLVASESYLDGQIASQDGEASLRQLEPLRRIAARFFRHHGGVYANARVPAGPLLRLSMLLRRYVPHRRQPLIFLFKDGPTAADEALVAALRGRFQLSDCDVG